MNFRSDINFYGSLQAELIRKDGSARDLGVLSQPKIVKTVPKRSILGILRKELPFLSGLALGAAARIHNHPDVATALVTTAGVNYLMATFVSGTNPLTNFKYHDCGTGTTAASISDTALQTPAGTARVSGTQSNPTQIQYQSIATISFTSSLAITEWGLFSAASAGTLWDRRVFLAVNVNNGDSIQFTYTVSGTAGGS
jgi:hypothetical protein